MRTTANTGTESFGWPAESVRIEYCARFPWSGGRHPWLDAFVVTSTHIIGIESKRYEPFRPGEVDALSPAYWRPVWGKEMGSFQRMRDRLRDQRQGQMEKGKSFFKHLNAVQLVKHALGLRTEAHRRSKFPVLIYLYAEPAAWANGRVIERALLAEHAKEVSQFASDVKGSEVIFRSCTYKKLLQSFLQSPSAKVREHGKAIRQRFAP